MDNPDSEQEGEIECDAKSYLPVCDSRKKPYMGQQFTSVNDAYQFYKKYGSASGFGTRLGSAKKGKHGQILYRYFICTREGYKPESQKDVTESSTRKTKRRRKPSTRNSCKATIKVNLRDEDGKYVVTRFDESHNHELVSEECRPFMKQNRKIDQSHQMIMLRCAKANIGSMRAFRIFKELVGGYDDVGCTSKDFKNLSYDINSHADGFDAQLLLDRFISKRDCDDGFKCEYLTDEFDKVKSLFWCDSIGVQNYSVFGDAVSFDATYSTNSKIHDVVWSDFEKKWAEVLDEYELEDHTWFQDMFSKRTYWIPAYFRELSMSGLFRTTSLSESENSFFRKYFNHTSNLAAFYIHFESAMDAQRQTFKQLCMVDQTTVPQLKTNSPLERHTAVIYTRNKFLEVQIEIMEGVNRCCIKTMDTDDEEHRYAIDDRSNGVFHVVHIMSEDTITCSCKHFVKSGLPCRHMFAVMRNMGLKAIPSKYIVHKWLKVASAGVLSCLNTKSRNKSLLAEAFRCIGIADGNDALTDSLFEQLRLWADTHSKDVPEPSTAAGKERMFEIFYGSKLPTVVNVHPPDAVRTKGSGKRLKSRFEVEAEKAKKPKRMCKKCGRQCST
ncbi:protein FAR1-RELATED SEQUENCE 5-like [Salvia miltiorrhiza]|uniref:protein FAR1-RELATED SEQUENCE 5-like n=1 Tax=Salvia miltiorrhiza TaxID=226208 RepID=UPI0025AC4B2D|nr:protein FAR1-RELATED SEQUENCE 5-like [Salvia miltiorrhiza]